MAKEQQYPTREQIAEALYCRDYPAEVDPTTWAELNHETWQADYLDQADAVLALFPQPTPSVYRCNGDAGCTDGFADGQGHSLRCQIGNRSQPTPSAEAETRQQRAQGVIDRNDRDRLRSTPSIADMAPGTTCDECGGSGVYGGPPDRYYDCPRCSGEPVNLDDTRDDRDPSTIRDVTLPPATPEATP